jgi:hypothetical protein
MPTKNAAADKLTMETAEKVFGWRDVHEHDGKLIGKKPDKLGRWRTATVPNYAHDVVQAFAIDERMKQLGRMERYLKELARLTKAENLPLEWATPEHRSRAALTVLKR